MSALSSRVLAIITGWCTQDARVAHTTTLKFKDPSCGYQMLMWTRRMQQRSLFAVPVFLGDKTHTVAKTIYSLFIKVQLCKCLWNRCSCFWTKVTEGILATQLLLLFQQTGCSVACGRTTQNCITPKEPLPNRTFLWGTKHRETRLINTSTTGLVGITREHVYLHLLRSSSRKCVILTCEAKTFLTSCPTIQVFLKKQGRDTLCWCPSTPHG